MIAVNPILTFDPPPPERRDYRGAQGEPLPGVTDILDGLGWNKDPLMSWAEYMGRIGKSHVKVRDDKADVGTQAHAYMEQHLRGQPVQELGIFATTVEERAFIAYRKWRAWWEQGSHGYTVRLVETQMVDVECGFGGTADAVFAKGTHAIVADLKTGKRPHDEAVIQLSAYAHLLFKKGIRVSGGLIMHFPVEGEGGVYEVPQTLLEHVYANVFVPLLLISKSRSSVEGFFQKGR